MEPTTEEIQRAAEARARHREACFADDNGEGLANLVRELQSQQEAAILYIAAVVQKAGGEMHLTADELKAAHNVILDRADTQEGGLLLRTTELTADSPLTIKIDGREFTKEGWWEVAKEAKPDVLREDFEAMWADWATSTPAAAHPPPATPTPRS